MDTNRQTELDPRQEGFYQHAADKMHFARTPMDYRIAASAFQNISGYRDADEMAAKCLEKAAAAEKDAVYEEGCALAQSADPEQLEKAITQLQTIPGWRDADRILQDCKNRLEAIREEQQMKARQQAAAEKKKRKTRGIVIAAAIVIVIAVIAIVDTIGHKNAYEEAMELLEEDKVAEAAVILRDHVAYKPAEEQWQEIEGDLLDQFCGSEWVSNQFRSELKGKRDLKIRHHLIMDKDGDMRQETNGTDNGSPYHLDVDYSDSSVTIQVMDGALYLCGEMDEFRIHMDGAEVEYLTGVYQGFEDHDLTYKKAK